MPSAGAALGSHLAGSDRLLEAGKSNHSWRGPSRQRDANTALTFVMKLGIKRLKFHDGHRNGRDGQQRQCLPNSVPAWYLERPVSVSSHGVEAAATQTVSNDSLFL
ncbi:unnamed protein product [Coccothraustes coccothraustes]